MATDTEQTQDVTDVLRDMTDAQGMEQPPVTTGTYNIQQKLRDQVPLSTINQELAELKGFDYPGAFNFLQNRRRQSLLNMGIPERNISEDDIQTYVDESILIELTDGQFERFSKAGQIQKGLERAMFEDLGPSLAFAKGAQEAFMRTPGPLPVKLLSGAGGGTLAATFAYVPGQYALSKFSPTQEVPSQRPTVEATRTFSGNLATILALPSILKQGSVDFLADRMARNIDGMSPGFMKKLATVGQKTVRGLERLVEGVAKPISPVTTKKEAAGKIALAAGVSVPPAVGAKIAENVDPYDPLTRVGYEVGISSAPVIRVGAYLTQKTYNSVINAFKNIVSKSGREDQVRRDMIAALDNLSTKYSDRPFNAEEFVADIETALEQSPLRELVDTLNTAKERTLREQGKELTPEQKLIVPPLTLAQSVAGFEKIIDGKKVNPLAILEALDRGQRRLDSKPGGYGEEAQRRYEDYKLFAETIMRELINEAGNDPKKLSQLAVIQEEFFAGGIGERLEAAKVAAIGTTQNLTPQQKRSVFSLSLFKSITDSLDEANSATDEMYALAKERLSGIEHKPVRALAKIREIQQVEGRTKIHPILSELQTTLSPDQGALEADLASLINARDEAQRIFLNRQAEADDYRLRQGLRFEEAGEFAPFGVARLLEQIKNETIDDQILALRRELDNLTEGGGRFQTQATRTEGAYIRKIIPALNAQKNLDMRQADVDNASSLLEGDEANPLAVSQILDFRSRLAKAQRQSVNVNDAQAVRDLGLVEEALIEDLEMLSGGSALLDAGPQQMRSFEQLLESLPAGESPVALGLALLRQANAFNRAKHDVFTRTFAGDSMKKSPKGGLARNPKTFLNQLIRGEADEVGIKITELEDAINWLNSDRFKEPREFLAEETREKLSQSAINRFGSYRAGKDDIARALIRRKNLIIKDRTSETAGQINKRTAESFLEDYREPLEPLFPDVFKDIERALEGRIELDDVIESLKLEDKEFRKLSLLQRFKGVEDNAAQRIRSILGKADDRKPNAAKNFQDLLDEINALSRSNPNEARDAREALTNVVIDEAYREASGESLKDIDFRKFREYLYKPLEKGGKSVATLLEENRFVRKDAFDNFNKLIQHAASVADLMKATGPISTDKLSDRGALLTNILLGASGAMSGNWLFEKLRPLIGNLPGASFSVAQSTASASRKLGGEMPEAKVQDILARALLYPEEAIALLKKAPKTEKDLLTYFGTIPAILYSSVARQTIPDVPLGETNPERPVDYVERTYEEVVPQIEPEREEAEQEVAVPMRRQEGPLSVQNNNPGNLRLAGQPGASEGEGGFAAFATPGQGLNALTRQVVLDTQTRGLSLENFLNKYAPPSENETNKYIEFVERQTGLKRDRKVPESKVPDLVRAIVRMEGGQTAMDYFFAPERQIAQISRQPAPAPVVQQPVMPAPAPAPARPTPQSVARFARVFPKDELAAEMLLRMQQPSN